MRSLQHRSRMLPRMYISRPRLLGKMFRATQCKLTIVCADAGYGKTTLVADFAASAGIQFEWYQLTPADRDVACLAEGLDRALQRLRLGSDSPAPRRTMVRHGIAPNHGVLTEVLLGQASRLGSKTCLLVLDDYQNVDQEDDVRRLLGALIEHSPANLRFVVLSRCVPRLPLAQLRAQQEVCVLEEDELAFTADETRRFLREESRLDLDEDALALIQDRTEGWAAGIAMVSQSLTHGRQDKVMAIVADPAGSAWLVYDYLAEEVFDRQEVALQSFLVRTSILGRLSASVCDYVLGTTSARPTLLQLEERGLFTASVDPSRETFRYHQLFREFLRQKLHQLESPDAIAALHRKAARCYEGSEDWEDCVHHLLKGGEPLKAAQVVETVGERYVLSGFFQTVDYWLRALPEGLIGTRPWLLALKGELSHMARRYDESLLTLERALRLFQAGGERDGQTWAAGQIAFVKYQSGRLQESIQDFAQALTLAKGSGILTSQLLVMRASAHREAGMLEESRADCLNSAAELETVDDGPGRAREQSRAIRNLALTQMEMGDLVAALRHGREALDFCLTRQAGEYEETWCRAELGAILWANGDLQEAIDMLHKALSLSARHIRYQQHFIGYWLGNALRDSGRYPEAEQAYAWGTEAAELEHAFLALLLDKGQAVAVKACALGNRHRSAENANVRSIAEVVLCAALRQRQEPLRALEHIREAVRFLASHGCQLRLASALLHQARLEYELLRPTEGRASLSRAFQLASSGGYRHFFWWDPELVAFLCTRALAESVFADYATELAMQRLDTTSMAALAPLLRDRRTEVRRRARQILSSPQGEPAGSPNQVLSSCGDPGIRGSLLGAIRDGLISSAGVATLRTKHGLSWREVEVLVEYYLRPSSGQATCATTLRSDCALRLSISEHTVRGHVSSLRSKLALPASISGRRVLEWAEQEGLLSTNSSGQLGHSSLPSR